MSWVESAALIGRYANLAHPTDPIDDGSISGAEGGKM